MSQLETCSHVNYPPLMTATGFKAHLDWIEANFVEILPGDEVVLDLRYATTNNFMNADLYGGFDRCFLHPKAAAPFARACAALRELRPDLQFHIWDALRPQSVQARMFEHLQGTPFETYVAAPVPGSMHNFGIALDLTLQTKDGELLEMGTDFDDFADLAQPQKEAHFLATGELTPEAQANRLLLRQLLETQGFRVLPHEWWHFNALPSDQVYGHYPALR